ncbi:MAG: hypothetical protein AAF328_00570 [Planctomycetota bacterium]
MTATNDRPRLVSVSRVSRVLLPLAAALLVFAGCTADRGVLPVAAFSDDGAYLPLQLAEGLVVDDASPLPDLPKPLRFVVVPSRSTASTDGRARTVTHIYQGRANVDDLTSFYREQLSNNGWQFLPGGNEGPIFSATKNQEWAQVALSRAGGVSTVTLLIRPR